ncbi:MAG TPA: L-histidine N(alpha)-methyltransferase, partial [Alphaproteobacteria bacterium]|nr:L-histidine N(alpha)-methyltransferase [Alphaproteobacteria bacterium]
GALAAYRLRYKSAPAHPREVCGKDFYNAYMSDLEKLLQKGEWNVYKWLHQPYATPEGPSGADMWANIVEFGHLRDYMLPLLEARLIHKKAEFLHDAFASLNPFGLMAGPGTRWAVMAKEVPTLHAINAHAAANWELCPRMGYEAAASVEKELGIKVTPIIRDFTEPLHGLDEMAKGAPVFITMYGCTLGNDINLEHVPANFARATNHRGFFLATIDSSSGEQAAAGYQSSLYQDFQTNYWAFAKYMSGDEDFDDLAIKCRPYYAEVYDPQGPEGVYKSVIHRHIVERDTSISIGRKRYFLKKGMEFRIGRSQKWAPEDIRAPFARAGWNELAILREGATSAVLYAGKDTPAEWLQPVLKALEASHDGKAIIRSSR